MTPIFIQSYLDGLSEDVKKQLTNSFEKISKDPVISASFASIIFEGNQEKSLGFDFKKKACNISGNMDWSKVLNFQFPEVVCREIDEDTANLLKKELYNIKKSNKRTWRSANGLKWINRLFYAKAIVFEVETSHKAGIEAVSKGIPFDIRSNGNSKTSISINGNLNVPFAFQFEKNADFFS